ncbi:MAG TPA: S8 family serine peptidase [Allosphingosinicella sp.]|nr:S8 family serine peptidase [Allosphingosinicella sp.]
MDEELRAAKLHPKLRMIRNGDELVNALRSEQSSGLVSTASLSDLLSGTDHAGAGLLACSRTPGNEAEFAPSDAAVTHREQLSPQREARHAYVGVFIEVHRDRQVGGAALSAEDVEGVRGGIDAAMSEAPGTEEIAKCVLSKRNFIAATVPITHLETLARDERVAFVQPAEPLVLDVPKPERISGPGLQPSDRSVVGGESGGGSGVIIGIIDVGGFDFAHPDFLDEAGETRFLSIWDQRGQARKAPSVRRGSEFERFEIGSEILRDDMNRAIAAERGGALPATILEPQSQATRSSHGTHVASIAAGRSGICPRADIAAVLIDVPFNPKDPEERRRTFADTTRLVLAVEYLLEVAREHDKPISINISLGTNGGSHDGAGGVSRWLDALLASEGRAITVAAGNAGQEGPTDENPNGWMVGRIHASGKVPSRGLVIDLEWTVVGNQIVDVSENELEIWYSPQDRFLVAVKPPGDAPWFKVSPCEYIENKRLPSGTFLSIYNELYNPVNGANYCAVYLSPDLRPDHFAGVQAGTWTVRLIGDEIRNGEFHCWIERDDPYRIGVVGGRQAMRMPSFFSTTSNVDSHSVSSLACGHRVIAVANLDARKQRISATSSQGPTRDSRFKPDIAAPGTAIVAANGFAGPDRLWVPMSGTSMASPYVAGVVGLMLAVNPRLTAAQCSAILQRTSQPLPGGAYEWRNDAGFGAVDPEKAVLEADGFDTRNDITKRVPA